MDLTTRAATRLAALKAADLLRRPPAISDRQGVTYRLDGKPVVGFCSNDYLGLAGESTGTVGNPAGASASRLIAGDLPVHRDVEASLARLCGSDDAVLFPSGFQLNVGVIPALLDARDCVHSDRLNHASIIDGLRLSRVKVDVAEHGAPPLWDSTSRSSSRRDGLHWWFTESIFSMDGDRLDTRALAEHQRRGGTVYVDDAHAFGLFPGGAGLLHDHPIPPDILVGTLSKSYGSAGAFVAASQDVCALIRNRARSFVFSTGTAPPVVADIAARIELLAGPRGEQLRARLWRNARHLDAALRGDALSASDPPSPIFPLLVGDNATALEVAAELIERGVHVQAIRPPTVPSGTARLRLTVTATHELEQIEELTNHLRTVLERRGLPLSITRGRVDPRPRSRSAEGPGR